MKIAVVLGGAEGAGDLAQRLGHQAGLEADVAVAHLALDLGAGHQRRDRVDDDDVERAGADQHVGDLERLLTGVGLGDEQRVGVDAERLGVLGVERVLGVDERRDAAGLLRVGDRVQGDGGLAEALRAVDLDDPAAGQAADAEGDVEGDRPGRDDLDRGPHVVAEAHDGTLAVLLLDLGHDRGQGLVALTTGGGGDGVGGEDAPAGALGPAMSHLFFRVVQRARPPATSSRRRSRREVWSDARWRHRQRSRAAVRLWTKAAGGATCGRP